MTDAVEIRWTDRGMKFPPHLDQEGAGEWLGVSARTGQNYAAKGPPEPVAKLLRLMSRLKLKPEDVK